MAVAITIALYTSPYGSHDFDQRSSSPSKSGDQFHQSPVSVINGPVTWTTSSSRRFISKGFVTHVFGTCVNSSTSKLSLEEDDDELMFSMDDENESCVKDMLLDAQLKYNVFNDDLVVKAFFEAAKAHKGQMRASGDPYLLHCVETAGLLAPSSSKLSLEEDDDELMFSMDDENESCVKDMLLDAQLKYNVFNDDLVVKAFFEAAKAHKGQMRASGDPYLLHCVETAGLLATIGANAVVVAAGLLHDTIDDSFMSYEYILETFGAGLADLVKGVSRLSELSKLARESNTATKIIEADRMHTMFLGMVDARAVLIKLADRLHNMMTLDALPLSKQYRFAKETMEIFAPLANRLGIVSWKEQLENLCFKYINPERYTDLSSQLLKSFNEAMVTSAAEKLEEALKDESVCYHVLYGRHKSLYSVHCKMLKKKLSMGEIHDVHGLRLIVENKEDCYKALKVVHGLWPEVPGKFKDYINQPKCNGYRSLHTVVMGEGLVPLEVQIRTKEMHSQAEYGFAAHWRYKEGDCMHSSFVLQMVEWARWVVTWQCEAMIKDQSGISYADVMKPPCKFPFHSEDCPHSYKPCGSDGPVFVIVIKNDEMSVQEFPANATINDVLDRAGEGSYRWSPYGFSVKQELIPKLNHEAVSDPSCNLKMGDVVELTQKIPDKSLIEKREEIQRMYESGLSTTSTGRASGNRVGWR